VWPDLLTRKLRDTSARSEADALRRGNELLLRVAVDPAQRASAPFSATVAAYIADQDWGPRHGDQQLSLLRTWVVPHLGKVANADLRIGHTEAMLRAARAAGRKPRTIIGIRRATVGVMRWAQDHDWLSAERDFASRARLPRPATQTPVVIDGAPRNAIRADQIPTHAAMHALAAAAADMTGEWWRELEYLLAGYGGLRWGERCALCPAKLDLASWEIVVDQQVQELDRADASGRRMYLDLPRHARIRRAWIPEQTPAGYSLIDGLARRAYEVGPSGLLFPGPQGDWQRRSNHSRRIFRPAKEATPGWSSAHPLHAARHLYCSWLLNELHLDVDDVMVLAGHSSAGSTMRYLGVRPQAHLRATAAARAAGLGSAPPGS
jgi:integrase